MLLRLIFPCESRAQLSALASKLQTQRIDALLASRVELVDRIKLLCQQLPPGHPSRPAAAFCDAPGALDGADGDEDGEGGGTSGGRGGSGGRRAGASDAAPENEIEDNWVQIAEEEERNPRRATVPGTLNKMLQAVAKHKWAYPFKRPVTDKEAPDYREVITNPMDFTTLKRRIETGAVIDVPALTADLVLIFENAMLYNGKGTDYYRMAGTLKEAVKAQQNLYNASRPEDPLAGGGRTAVGGAAGTAEEGVEAPAPPEDVTMAAADDDADAPDADADAPAEAPAEAPASSSAAAPRRGGRRGARG